MGNRRTFTSRQIAASAAGSSLRLFTDAEDAVLINRPNRFVMMVQDASGRTLKCYCPNPGKLTEFLIPGQPLLIRRRADSTGRTEGTVVAVQYRGKTVFLESSKANDVARYVVLPYFHPGKAVIPEWSEGSSRFDFLLQDEPDILMEVKSCSLVEHTLAMFPDTATLRGSRHIQELSSLASTRRHGSELLFIISHEDARQFMPNPHTDPEFCMNLHRAQSHIAVHASSVATNREGLCTLVNPEIPIDTDTPARLAESNSGVYLLVLRLDKPFRLPVPRIGSPLLSPGWYMYVGSAMHTLKQRTARHRRKKKAPHWHIDYLTSRSASLTVLPIATFHRLECRLADELAMVSPAAVQGFGCSDCSCDSHLFTFPGNPLHRQDILNIHFRYRHRVFLDA